MDKRYQKIQTIEAIEELMYRYQNPGIHKHIILSPADCPLCKVHQQPFSICRGCPLANISGTTGCIEFTSFKNLANVLHNDKKFYEAAKRRGRFFKRILPMIEKMSAKRFTNEEWYYAHEIDRSW